MSTLRFLKNYNNYFNRIEKKRNNIATDFTNITSKTFTDMNFNSNDGVFTEHIINWSEKWKPDYMLLLSENTNFNDSIMDSLSYAKSFENNYNTYWEANSATELANLGIYDPESKQLNLLLAAEYNNAGYDEVKIDFEGEWDLDKFSFKINNFYDYTNIYFWSDNNAITISAGDIENGIVNKELLVQNGWLDEEDVWGFRFIYSSPADADGIAIFEDFNTEIEIAESWFVIEMKRTRGNQYHLQLKKDVIADNYNNVVNAPCLIDRGMINNINNPLLYNDEGFSFNQIKKQEILLKDETQIPWYILYFKKGISSLTDSFNPSSVSYDKKISTTIQNSIYAGGSKYYLNPNNFSFTYRANASIWAWAYASNQYNMLINSSGVSSNFNFTGNNTDCKWFINGDEYCSQKLIEAFTGSFNNLVSAANTDIGLASSITESEYNELISMNGKYILDSANKLYKITVSNDPINLIQQLTSGTAVDLMNSYIAASGLTAQNDYNSLYYNAVKNNLVVSIVEITTSTITWTLDWSSQTQTNDSDFNIIAIPYGNINLISNGLYYINSNSSQLLVQSIIQKAASNLVDIQLFPYCPVLNSIAGPNSLATSDMQSSQYFISSNHEIIMLYVNSSNFSFNISQLLTIENRTNNQAINYKLSNECDLVKIVSPNYNGSFEFSIAKNQGVDYFNIDCTLIPYQPYIHVNPNFKALYGRDWNDSKGLLCGGDFSLPKYTDAWEQYQLNNKNYQQIFDRQIRNLDFTQGQEKILANFNALAGTVQGTATGAGAGAMAGGPWGALIGGVVGLTSSGLGGAIDVSMLNERQSEQKSLTIDTFKYNLGNIKALPDTINKTTPLTYNNKKFPFIEIYTATDTEKLILENTITYKSMKINSIGPISDYLIEGQKTFISGNLIRLEDLGIESNEAYEIYNEIKKGVYFE